MYLEECDPTLQSAILSAIESSSALDNPTETGPSPRLVERLVEQAIDRCRAIENGMAIERPKLRRQALTLAAVVIIAALILAVRARLPAARHVRAAHRRQERR